MRRREFIAGLLLAATMGRTRAQQTTKAYRIAFVDPATSVAEMNERTNLNPFIQAFFRELRQLGYVEGQNILIERYSGKGRAAAGQTAYYPGFVGEVVRQKPDLIFVMGNHLLLDFKAETTTIPIVGAAADPVEAGIVPSLSRPGGNITGVSPFFDLTIWSKYVEYLTEAGTKSIQDRTSRLAPRLGNRYGSGSARGDPKAENLSYRSAARGPIPGGRVSPGVSAHGARGRGGAHSWRFARNIREPAAGRGACPAVSASGHLSIS
jgi:hypothetical protein